MLAAWLGAAFPHQRVEPTPRRVDATSLAAFAAPALAAGTGFGPHEGRSAEPMAPPAR
jgi:hypothetical protein